MRPTAPGFSPPPPGRLGNLVELRKFYLAEGELLNITTIRNERHTITYRLKGLETRLDPTRFVRLGRGTLANVDLIARVMMMPGGTHVAVLSNGQRLPISRLQFRIIRERLLRL